MARLTEPKGRMNNYGTVGLVSVPVEFSSSTPSSYNMTNISGQGVDRKIEGNRVTYSYSMKEFSGLDTLSTTDKIVRSSSSCIGRTLNGISIYEDGRVVGNLCEWLHRSTLVSRGGLYNSDRKLTLAMLLS